jgi:hypothetical protein
MPRSHFFRPICEASSPPCVFDCGAALLGLEKEVRCWGIRDGVHLLLIAEERAALIDADRACEQWILPFRGAERFMKGGERYCL